MRRIRRIGLIVPSSNVTVETELPALLRRIPDVAVSFHASRMTMTDVSPDGLAAMNAQLERCVAEIADVEPDAVLYACLVALMAGPPGEHGRAEEAVALQLSEAGHYPVVRSSAGALVEALNALAATRVALVTPYMRPLAEKVVNYLEAESFDVAAWRALEVADNAEVGCIPGEQVMRAARSIDLAGVEALVISACVQMPSLDLVELAEREFGIPVLSAATAGAFSLLKALELPLAVPDAGSLLRSGSLAGVHQEVG